MNKSQLRQIIRKEIRSSLKRMNEQQTIDDFEDYISALFDMSAPEDAEEGEIISGIWEKSEYASDAYDDPEVFMALSKYLASVGGKATLEGNPDISLNLVKNGDIAWSAIASYQ